ncbi:hypothetical protein ACU686_26675 [Yinghuangia aomiensis]
MGPEATPEQAQAFREHVDQRAQELLQTPAYQPREAGGSELYDEAVRDGAWDPKAPTPRRGKVVPRASRPAPPRRRVRAGHVARNPRGHQTRARHSPQSPLGPDTAPRTVGAQPRSDLDGSTPVTQPHITAEATREGTGGPNADATAVYTAADGSTCAAIVDGIGHDSDTVALALVLATVAARIGAQRGALAGLLTAALMVADEGADGDEPDAACAVALARPGGDTVVAWAGDCRAYGWNGRRLRLYTNDHTVGRQLRESGGIPIEVAESHDSWLRVSSLARRRRRRGKR